MGLGPKDPQGNWRPQMLLYASEQGWPSSPTMNISTQARNICYAQELSEQVWAAQIWTEPSF